MSVSNVTLPSDETQLAKLLEQHVQREKYRLSFRRVMWLLSWYYLQGARHFDVFNVRGVQISGQYVDQEGRLSFQSQELLRAIDQNTGRLASADLRPQITRDDMSLAGLRERAVAQVIADAACDSSMIEKAGAQFSNLLVTLGCCGIMGHVENEPALGLTTDFEVIHPRELMPFPSLGADPTKQQGIVRSRLVPLSWLKEKYGKKIGANLEKMRWFQMAQGAVLPDIDGTMDVGTGSTAVNFHGEGGFASAIPATDVPAEENGMVRINELWLNGCGDTLDRYVVSSGDYCIKNEDFKGRIAYCPIGVARLIENGTFHGLGLFDLLFGISRELETLLQNLFTNIKDMDRYGFLVMPRGSYNKQDALRDVGRGLRVLSYEPDISLSESNFKPFAVQPYTTGELPGKVATMAKQMLDGLNPIRDLIAEKGRVDSASGLEFLDEQINNSISTGIKNQRIAWSDCYRNVVSQAASILAKSPSALPVSRLDLSLAGAVIDAETDTVSFRENPLPDVSRLRFSVKDELPSSTISRKREAVEFLQMQLPGGPIVDTNRFMAIALKEGLDYAIYMDDYQSAHQTVVRNILFLYGDGQAPGQVIITPATVRPDYQMMILQGFLCSPAMAKASPQVQDELVAYRDTLMQWMGLTLPNAIPNPDDVALAQSAQQNPQVGPGHNGTPSTPSGAMVHA